MQVVLRVTLYKQGYFFKQLHIIYDVESLIAPGDSPIILETYQGVNLLPLSFKIKHIIHIVIIYYSYYPKTSIWLKLT